MSQLYKRRPKRKYRVGARTHPCTKEPEGRTTLQDDIVTVQEIQRDDDDGDDDDDDDDDTDDDDDDDDDDDNDNDDDDDDEHGGCCPADWHQTVNKSPILIPLQMTYLSEVKSIARQYNDSVF